MSDTIEVAVCILGAGPVGATLAATLAAAGLPTAVVDSQRLPGMEDSGFDGRAYAIALTSKRLLQAAGIWARLETSTAAPPCPILRIRVADGRPGEPPSPLSLHFDAQQVGAEPFGFMVEARSLRQALNARLPHLPNLHVFAPATAVSVERTTAGATIRLATSQEGDQCGTRTIHARLVVGAEGRNSPSRLAAGIRAATLDYRQIGMVGAFAHELPHHNVALEQFLPNGPFAQLPLSGPGGFGTAELPHASAFVWADRTMIAQRMLALPEAAFGRELRRRLGGHLGAIRPVGRRWSYPLSALLVERWTDTRLALVGDAAHGVHPIAGQGLNLGFRDVAALAEEAIAAWNGGGDPGAPDVLTRYQARRRPDTLLMLSGMHALERLFGNDLPPVRLARRLGIAAVDRIPALKRAFARQAMGLGPGVTGLLAGQGLLGGGTR